MTPDQFSALVEAVRQYLEDLSHTSPAKIAACKSGEDFEVCVGICCNGCCICVFYVYGVCIGCCNNV